MGKLEFETGLSREQVVKALDGLRRRGLAIETGLGEVKHAYRIIPKTKKDLTQYRKGETRERVFVAGACFHIPDTSVDYEFLGSELFRILSEERADILYIVGDVTEGIKYNQDRKGELLDRLAGPSAQKEAPDL